MSGDGIMNKIKSAIRITVLLIIAILLVNIARLYNENYSLKNIQGAIISGNLSHISGTIYDANKDLADNTISNLNRYYWQFNEFTRLELPRSIVYYSMNIRNDYGELIRLNESNAPQQEINRCKKDLELHLSRLKTAISIIMKECSGNDNSNMKFYLLNSTDNEIMKKVLEILSAEYTDSNNE